MYLGVHEPRLVAAVRVGDGRPGPARCGPRHVRRSTHRAAHDRLAPVVGAVAAGAPEPSTGGAPDARVQGAHAPAAEARQGA
ncbi:hypothetical protein AQJ11_14550 [Streptomyces corchorusii]|uniref:Uncharacterized protein n=1 Tax=Streptomyces corchorusii TaxID=1903 RepID=A0A101QD96_STRCK|nr:hypothetical protein AQJ11_14550 [Streptomyces corchorusii]